MIGTRARTAGLVESPLLSNGHGGFGKRFGETGWLKDRYRAPNRLRGGKDNFESDRVAAEKVLALVPGLRRSVLENRRFLRRVVRFQAAEAGVSQFLDVGVGLPTQGAVHEVASEVNPGARVVYVDYDPVVVSHGRALLAVSDLSIMVQGDLRRPADLLAMPEVRAHLDFSRPVAIGLLAVLHFVSYRVTCRCLEFRPQPVWRTLPRITTRPVHARGLTGLAP